MRRPRGERVWFMLGLGVVAAWLIVVLHPLGTGTRTIQGEGDAYLHVWYLWWVYRALIVEGTTPYFTTYSGYPHGVRLTYHSLILPMGLASIPLLAAGFSASQAYVIWLYLVPIAGYVGAFFLLRRMRAPPLGCTAGALFWVCRPAFWRHLARPDRFFYLVLPWVVLSVLLLRERGGGWVVLSGALGAVVVLMSPYYGVGLLVFWLLGFYMISAWSVPVERYAWVGPLMLLFSAFEWVPRLLGTPPSIEVPFGILTRPESYLVPPLRLPWARLMESLFGVSPASPAAGYLGTVGVLLVVLTAWRRWGKTVRWCLGVGIVFWGLIASPPWIVAALNGLEAQEILPGAGVFTSFFEMFRMSHRLMVFPILLMALGLGFYGGWQKRWGVLLLVLLVVDQLAPPVRHVRELPPAETLRSVRRRRRAPAVVHLPLLRTGAEPAYGQTVHHLKMALGPASYLPTELRRFLTSNPVLNALLNRESPPERGWQDLRDLGYGGFLLHFWPRGDTRNQPILRLKLGRRWPTLRLEWQRALRARYGAPVLKNRFFELYRFDGRSGDDVTGKARGIPGGAGGPGPVGNDVS